MKHFVKIIIILAAFQICAAAKALEQPIYDIIGKAKVVDGDTIIIDKTHIRMFGVDAPESKQTCSNSSGEQYLCGVESKKFLKDLIGAKTVYCKSAKLDKYGRTVASCYLREKTGDFKSLEAEMALNGWALAYRKYSNDYIEQERAAKKSKAGIWQGKFQKPWKFRHQNNG